MCGNGANFYLVLRSESALSLFTENAMKTFISTILSIRIISLSNLERALHRVRASFREKVA